LQESLRFPFSHEKLEPYFKNIVINNMLALKDYLDRKSAVRVIPASAFLMALVKVAVLL